MPGSVIRHVPCAFVLLRCSEAAQTDDASIDGAIAGIRRHQYYCVRITRVEAPQGRAVPAERAAPPLRSTVRRQAHF